MQQQAFLPLLPHRFNTLIWSCLDSDLTQTAVFYAERYHCIDKDNHDALHLHATALLRNNQLQSALRLVDRPLDQRCAACLEIKAKCCTALGRHRDAREALEMSLADSTVTSSVTSRETRPFPEEAVLHCRAGTAAMKGNLQDRAARSFAAALSLNPMLWEAFEGLCALGASPEDLSDIFPPRPAPVKRTPATAPVVPVPPTTTVAVAGTHSTGHGFFTPDANNPGPKTWGLFRLPEIQQDDSFYGGTMPHHPFRPKSNQASTSVAPPPPARPFPSVDDSQPQPKRQRSTTNSRPGKPTQGAAASRKGPPSAATTTMTTRASVKGGERVTRQATGSPARRGTRLVTDKTGKQTHAITHLPQRRNPTRIRSRSAETDPDDDMIVEEVGRAQSPPHSPRSNHSPQPETWTAAHDAAAQETFDIESADLYIYDLMRLFASATRALAIYDCTGCLEELEKLPFAHRNSAWVMAMVGRAHFERVEYSAAERAFSAARALDPYRLRDMEVFSTLLWHLEKNVELSFLAQELLAIDPSAPQAWITAGNCFSLQKERSQALTCFRRAAQLDPACAYAYTLSGHETIEDDLQKAVNFFQSALQADARHYRAWYGLGTCYLRQSKIKMAEYHYRKALAIHSKNAVLLGCVGMAVERRGDLEGAFTLYDEAVRLAPENALVRYRRAKLLIAQKRYRAAVEDLESLHDSSPDESNVVFQLAKAYRLVGDDVRSAQMLAAARDVSPKSMNKIRKLMEIAKDADGESMEEE